MSSEFKVIVVGAGSISDAWFPPLKAEGVHVAAVVDLRKEAAEAQIAKHQLNAMASTNFSETLQKVKADFVLDLTVPVAHANITCQALEAGLPVIGEKPMADSMENARKMVATAEKTGKLYMVSQSRRWDAKHKQLKDTILSGQLGKLTMVNCDFYIGAHFGGFRDEMASPLILDMAIHHFDLLRYLTDADPVAVYAKEFNPVGSWYKGDAAAVCIFEMSNGVIFTYRGSWCAEGYHTSWNGDWRIIGQNGTLMYEQDKEPYGQVVIGGTNFFRDMRDVAISPPALEFSAMHGALREMLAFLRTGKKPQTECHDNIKSLAMVFGVLESSKKGTRIPIAS